jgi:DNA-binding protein H-NS
LRGMSHKHDEGGVRTRWHHIETQHELCPVTFVHGAISFVCKKIYMRNFATIEWTKQMQLKSMSLDKLVALRNQVEAVLSAKVVEERRTLESALSKLTRFTGGSTRLKISGRGGAVAAKYRNPENPSETWAGRGLKPRWLALAIKSGKKQEDFLIAGASRAAARKAAPKKRGRPKKAK